MAKIGRNDPCPCGSGKKYKNCHLPIEQATEAEQRQLRQSFDTLWPKIITAAQGVPEVLPDALARFWEGKYTPEQLEELDDIEDRGAERFLTWLAFDYVLDDGSTLVERLQADPSSLELSEAEAQVFAGWSNVHVRPYAVVEAVKGQSIMVRNMLEDTTLEVHDHAASRRVELGEVLIMHAMPVGEQQFIGGAAAHLTEDTREKLQEFMALHLEAYQRDTPDASWAEFMREHSEVLNHFVMALPVEAPDPTILENILLQTRISLKLAGESLGIGRGDPA